MKSFVRHIDHIKLFFVSIFAVIILLFVGKNTVSYYGWLEEFAAQENLMDLTSERITWEVHYGKSPLCGPIECHLTHDYSGKNYERRVILPSREFPLSDYQTGDIIYLRTTLTVPDRLLNSAGPLGLYSLYIWAKEYRIYINGFLVDRGMSRLT